jgi:hypothetical protein
LLQMGFETWIIFKCFKSVFGRVPSRNLHGAKLLMPRSWNKAFLGLFESLLRTLSQKISGHESYW